MFSSGDQFISHSWKSIQEIQNAIENKDKMFENNVTNEYLFYKCLNANWIEIIKWMIERFKDDSHELSYYLRESLEYSAKNNNMEYFNWLMSKEYVSDVDVNKLFECALLNNHPEFCNMMLENKYISKNYFSEWDGNQQFRLIKKCCDNESIDALHWLYERFEITIVNKSEITSLFYSAQAGRIIGDSELNKMKTIYRLKWFLKYYPHSIEEANEWFRRMITNNTPVYIIQCMMDHYPYLEITDELFLSCICYPTAEWIVSLYPDKYEVKKETYRDSRRRKKFRTITMLREMGFANKAKGKIDDDEIILNDLLFMIKNL